MLKTTKEYLERFLKKHPISGKVLDVGSLDVNGNVRDFFDSGWEYVGIDMEKGNNVDIVLNAHDIKTHFKENEFDLVICFDTLEHDDRFWETMENIRWVLKSGGWVVIGTPSINHPIHKHPNDYYRFTTSVYLDVFFKNMKNATAEHQWYHEPEDNKPDQVFGYAQKP